MANIITVAGGGGFIGGHLVKSLLEQGNSVRAIDIKPLSEWHQVHSQAVNIQSDLQDAKACVKAVEDATQIYNLAADMGGMGFIENNKTLCMLSVLINTNLLRAAVDAKVKRYFFSSTACVYPQDKQTSTDVTPLKESYAYPAMSEDGYGWEKLFSERMCRHFMEDFGIETRVARLHSVYGPHGTYDGGREKVPAAICRKVAQAKLNHKSDIEIWGDGKQQRSFMYIDDCVKGILEIMASEVREPLNLGSAQAISINELVDIVEDIADISVKRSYNLNAPQGVRGRTSDNTLFHSYFGWEPSTSLQNGLKATYNWVESQLDISNHTDPHHRFSDV